MAEAAGKSGHVKQNGSVIAGMKEWNLDYIANEGVITDFESSGHKEIIVLTDEWSGTIAGSLDGTPLTLGTSYDFSFLLTATLRFFGAAFIMGVHPSVTVDGVNVLSYDIVGSGELQYGAVE